LLAGQDLEHTEVLDIDIYVFIHKMSVGKQVSVNDPDQKIFEWFVANEDDDFIVGNIEEMGSISTYLEADYVLRKKFEQLGFTVTQSESIISSAKRSETGDTLLQRFVTLVQSTFKIITVVGEVGEDYNDHRCFKTFFLNKPHSYYEYARWMDSMFDLVDQDCYLLCVHDEAYNFSDTFSKTLSELFPGTELKILYHGSRTNNVTIRLSELTKLFN